MSLSVTFMSSCFPAGCAGASEQLPPGHLRLPPPVPTPGELAPRSSCFPHCFHTEEAPPSKLEKEVRRNSSAAVPSALASAAGPQGAVCVGRPSGSWQALPLLLPWWMRLCPGPPRPLCPLPPDTSCRLRMALMLAGGSAQVGWVPALPPGAFPREGWAPASPGTPGRGRVVSQDRPSSPSFRAVLRCIFMVPQIMGGPGGVKPQLPAPGPAQQCRLGAFPALPALPPDSPWGRPPKQTAWVQVLVSGSASGGSVSGAGRAGEEGSGVPGVPAKGSGGPSPRPQHGFRGALHGQHEQWWPLASFAGLEAATAVSCVPLTHLSPLMTPAVARHVPHRSRRGRGGGFRLQGKVEEGTEEASSPVEL